MFYALSAHEEFWKERLNLFVALAPVTRLDHTSSRLLKYLAPLGGHLETVLGAVGIHSLFGPVSNGGVKVACRFFPGLCKFGEGLLITQNPQLDNEERFQVYMAHFPAGASVRSLTHYSQMINS